MVLYYSALHVIVASNKAGCSRCTFGLILLKLHNFQTLRYWNKTNIENSLKTSTYYILSPVSLLPGPPRLPADRVPPSQARLPRCPRARGRRLVVAAARLAGRREPRGGAPRAALQPAAGRGPGHQGEAGLQPFEGERRRRHVCIMRQEYEY